MRSSPQPPDIAVPTEGYWEKDDWHYPTPMTAFGASIYLPALEHGLAVQCREFGILSDGEQQRWIGHEVYGRTVPYRGRRWPAWPWWRWAIASRVSPELRRRARIADDALRSGLADRYLAAWPADRERFRLDTAVLRGRDLRALEDEALLGHLDEAIELHRRGSVSHFRLNTPYSLAIRELYAVGRELLGWSPSEVLHLLAGASEISSAPGRMLSAVAIRVASSRAASAVLDQPGADVLDRLRVADADAAAALADYLEAYGHRPTGYDPGDPTLAERPDLIVRLLRERLGHDGRAATGHGNERHDAPLQRARATLAGRPQADRDRFERAHADARRAYPVREESIFFADSLPSGVLRYAALEIGRRLVEHGSVEVAEDAVHLTVDELRAALRASSSSVREIVDRRRAERAWVRAHPGPATYGREEGIPPDLRGFPSALRHFNEPWLLPVRGLEPPSPRPGDAANELVGASGAPGRYTGTVRVIRDASEFDRLRAGEVLVCPITSPPWSVLVGHAGALVTDAGGASSHAAIIAREYGIPAVLGTGNATRRLDDGVVVTVDGSAGRVIVNGPVHENVSTGHLEPPAA